MQLVHIEDQFYSNIHLELKKVVPEFHSVFEEEYGVFPILGEFGNFVVDNINNKIIFNKVILFIENAIEYGKHKTLEAISIQIFSKIIENEKIVIMFQNHLSREALLVFNTYYDELKLQ